MKSIMKPLNKMRKIIDVLKIYKHWKKGEGYGPLRVTIYPTFECNLKCRMCFHWRYSFSKPELTTEEYYSLFEKLRYCNTKHINIGGGEPTLRKNFLSIIRIAKEQGFTVSMVTNGTLIKPKYAEELVQYVDSIMVSIHSSIPEIHDEITGIRGSWEKAVNSLKNIDRARKKFNTKTSLITNSVITKINYSTADKIIDLLDIVEFDLPRISPINTDYGIYNSIDGFKEEIMHLRLNKQDIEDYNKNIAPKIIKKVITHKLEKKMKRIYPSSPNLLENFAYIFGKDKDIEYYLDIGRSKHTYYQNRIFCFYPYWSAHIMPDGKVIPCAPALLDSSNYIMGNIKNESISKIWNGEKFKRFREKCQPPKHVICNNCCLTPLETNKILMKYSFLSRIII